MKQTEKSCGNTQFGASVTAPPSIVDGMMLCGTDNWYTYAFDLGIGGGNWILSRYDTSNTAYTKEGLLSWQFVSATCTTEQGITTCIVENKYDHQVSNITLQLPTGMVANWADTSGHLLQSTSNHLVIDHLKSQASVELKISTTENLPPGTPILTGPTSGKNGKEYVYKATSIDPDNNQIYYQFNWGDGTQSPTLGPYQSGETCEVFHSWNQKGEYQVMVKAIDSNDVESNWSDPLLVQMHKTKFMMFSSFHAMMQQLKKIQ